MNGTLSRLFRPFRAFLEEKKALLLFYVLLKAITYRKSCRMILFVAKREIKSQTDKKALDLYTCHRGKAQLGDTAIITTIIFSPTLPIARNKKPQVRSRSHEYPHVIRHLPSETGPQGNLEHMTHQRGHFLNRLRPERPVLHPIINKSPLRIIQTGLQRKIGLELVVYSRSNLNSRSPFIRTPAKSRQTNLRRNAPLRPHRREYAQQAHDQ